MIWQKPGTEIIVKFPYGDLGGVRINLRYGVILRKKDAIWELWEVKLYKTLFEEELVFDIGGKWLKPIELTEEINWVKEGF